MSSNLFWSQVELFGRKLANDDNFHGWVEFLYCGASITYWAHTVQLFLPGDYVYVVLNFMAAYAFFSIAFLFVTYTAKDIFKN